MFFFPEFLGSKTIWKPHRCMPSAIRVVAPVKFTEYFGEPFAASLKRSHARHLINTDSLSNTNNKLYCKTQKRLLHVSIIFPCFSKFPFRVVDILFFFCERGRVWNRGFQGDVFCNHSKYPKRAEERGLVKTTSSSWPGCKSCNRSSDSSA